MNVAKQRFTTKIDSNGVKLFVFRIELAIDGDNARPGPGGPPRKGMHFNNMRPGGGNPGARPGLSGGQRADFVTARLNEKLKITGFCRTGHEKMNRFMIGNAVQIHGKCKELATDEDRSMFANPKA